MRLLLLYNPAAGKGRAHKHIAEAVTRLQARGVEVELQPSRSREHLIELGAAAAESGADRIVACGGDGTVNLVLRRLDLGRTSFGILPLGSGDDFARTCGIPTDLDRACEVLLNGVERPIDVALANDVRYVCVAGFGFDAEVNRAANESDLPLRGTALYLTSIFKVLRKFEPRVVAIQNGASAWSQEMMFLVVANSPRYGAGIHIAPHAVPDDGQLDLCVVGKCGKLELVRTLPLAYSGGHLKRSFVHYQKGREFRFETPLPMDVYADGEPVTTTPVTFSIAPEKLRLLVPG